MNEENSLESIEEDEKGDSPLVVGQRKERVPLWINSDWTEQNNQPLLENREENLAYWFDKNDLAKLVDFVKTK